MDTNVDINSNSKDIEQVNKTANNNINMPTLLRLENIKQFMNKS